jgi:hypothetical protein
MASFVWMLLTEPSYKPNTLTARSLASEESKPEDARETTTFDAAGWYAERGTIVSFDPGPRALSRI